MGGVSFEWERASGWEEGPHFAKFGCAIREVALHRYIGLLPPELLTLAIF